VTRVALPLLTSSSSKLYRACPRAYRHRYVDGVVSIARPTTLSFGSAMHAGLEQWWLHQLRYGPPLEAALAAVAPVEDEIERIKLEELLRLYDARWSEEPLEVLAVEAEYRAPLLNPETGAASRTFQRAGKIDAIVRHRENGRVLLVEHKTSREDIGTGSRYWQRLTLDGQISHYYAGAEALGWRVDACLYDVIAVPRLSPLAATPTESRRYTKAGKLDARQRDADETPEAFRERFRTSLLSDPDRWVRRAEVVRLEDDVLDAAYDDWSTATRIRESERSGRWPRNPDACERYGRLCEMHPVCTRAASIDDPLLYRHERPHRELTADVAPEEPATAAE
jgi:hypothetical protein